MISQIRLFYSGITLKPLSKQFAQDSLDKAKRWLNELYSAGRTDMVISFVGNKCDLSDNRQVEVEV